MESVSYATHTLALALSGAQVGLVHDRLAREPVPAVVEIDRVDRSSVQGLENILPALNACLGNQPPHRFVRLRRPLDYPGNLLEQKARLVYHSDDISSHSFMKMKYSSKTNSLCVVYMSRIW